MTDKIIIRFEQVTKQYDYDQMVLDHVSFEIERGKFYTLLRTFRLWEDNYFTIDCRLY